MPKLVDTRPVPGAIRFYESEGRGTVSNCEILYEDFFDDGTTELVWGKPLYIRNIPELGPMFRILAESAKVMISACEAADGKEK